MVRHYQLIKIPIKSNLRTSHKSRGGQADVRTDGRRCGKVARACSRSSEELEHGSTFRFASSQLLSFDLRAGANLINGSPRRAFHLQRAPMQSREIVIKHTDSSIPMNHSPPRMDPGVVSSPDSSFHRQHR